MPGLMPSKLAAMGRGGDTEIGHLTKGEVVLPRALADSPSLRDELTRAFERAGIPIGRYTVGGQDDSINPRTGMREFFVGDPGDGPGVGGSGSGSGSGGGGPAGGTGPGSGVGGAPGQAGPSGTGGVDYGGGVGDRGGVTDMGFVTTDDVTPRGWSRSAYAGYGSPSAITAGTLDSPRSRGLMSAVDDPALAATISALNAADAAAAGRTRSAGHSSIAGIPGATPDLGLGVAERAMIGALPLGSLFIGMEELGRRYGWAPGQRMTDAEAIAAAQNAPGGVRPTTADRYMTEAEEPSPTGFYTPPYDPAVHGPSWRKYLDV